MDDDKEIIGMINNVVKSDEVIVLFMWSEERVFNGWDKFFIDINFLDFIVFCIGYISIVMCINSYIVCKWFFFIYIY